MHIEPPTDQLLPGIVTLIPAVVLTIGVVAIGLIALSARSATTRRHHLSVITALTDYARALRSRR